MKNKIKLTESQLHNIIRESVMGILNEVSQQTKAKSFVKGNNAINDLKAAKKRGERTFERNGRTFDIDNEINRKSRQMKNFGDSLAHDLAMEHDPSRESFKKNIDSYSNSIRGLKKQINDIKSGARREEFGGELETLERELEREKRFLKSRRNDTHGYGVNALNGDGYSITTPNGSAYSNSAGNGINYADKNQSNVTRMSKFNGITDAMQGYDDELNGHMDKDIESLERRKRNVQAIRDYEKAKTDWNENDRRIKHSQNEYDRMSSLNPKKWFSKRPEDGPAAPEHPRWEPNENGEYDGYFAHHNPEDYDSDIETVRNRQKRYRDAKDRYFGK